MEYYRIILSGSLCLLAVWMQAAAGAPAGRHPGCQRKCGGVDIPYPFGINSDDPRCAIHRGFQLNCTTVDGALKPFAGTVEVTKISVPNGKAWMKTWISSQCYDPGSREMLYNNAWFNSTGTPYWLSDVDNTIIVVGCNTLAYMMSDPYVIGCKLTCFNGDVKNGTCSGAGCCRADLPKGIQYYISYFNENYNNTDPKWRRSPCGYMAVMETAAFSFSTTYLTSTVFNDTYKGQAPVVMDWVITPDTCEEAKRNTSSYACVSSNSSCVDMNGQGYRCKCSSGYEGNPYIEDGCIDIDECLHNVTYPCAGICKNTLGSFTCTCPRGKQMMNGVCTPNRANVVGLSVGIGVGSGAGLLFLVFGASFVTRKVKHRRAKKLKQKFFKQNRGHLLQQLVSQRADIAERMIIPLEELEKATNNFNKARELGGGGHGTVYKGFLSDLHVVAIKKSNVAIQREIDEFINEVAILSQINHRNVVKLFGCCLETEVPLLVYEFISNGTLYQHLHVEGPISLSWEDRLRIATETARALAYLHSAVSLPIIHRDIKSHNILLDGTLTTKVSDFGASRCVPVDQTGVTTVVQGTRGYLDPMCYYTGRLTEKSDVYSFGVILIELLTRKKPFSYTSSEGVSLVAHFTSLVAEGSLVHVLDPQVIEEGGRQMEELAALAAVCVKLEAEERPTMRQVEMTLESLGASQEHAALHNIVARRSAETHVAVTYPTTAGGGQESSRQYSLEVEYLLSARYPR